MTDSAKRNRRDEKRKRSKAKRIKHNYWKREQKQLLSKKFIKLLKSKIHYV